MNCIISNVSLIIIQRCRGEHNSINYYIIYINLTYYPILLTCQMHTDYTVIAHNLIIFKPFSVVFVKCTDNNQQLDVYSSSVSYS